MFEIYTPSPLHQAGLNLHFAKQLSSDWAKFSPMLRQTRDATECCLDPKNPKLRLDHIAAVGAFIEPEGLDSKDMCWLAGSVRFGFEMGLDIAKDPQISIVNLLYGADALKPQKRPAQTDMFVGCFLYHPPTGIPPNEPNNAAITLSDQHFVKGIWGKAAAEMGAKIITTFSQPLDCQELTIGFFSHPDYILGPVLPTFALHEKNCVSAMHMETMLHVETAEALGMSVPRRVHPVAIAIALGA